MLRLSKKGDYSVFLMATLARQELLHREATLGPSTGAPPTRDSDPENRDHVPTMSAHRLSKLSGLGRSYVANLLKDFAKAGLLTSVRGQQGGYRLSKPPEAISLRETLAVIEGPLRFVGCAAPSSTELCDLIGICPSTGPMQVIHNRIVHLLEDLSLAELARSGMPALSHAQPDQGGRNEPIEPGSSSKHVSETNQ